MLTVWKLLLSWIKQEFLFSFIFSLFSTIPWWWWWWWWSVMFIQQQRTRWLMVIMLTTDLGLITQNTWLIEWSIVISLWAVGKILSFCLHVFSPTCFICQYYASWDYGTMNFSFLLIRQQRYEMNVHGCKKKSKKYYCKLNFTFYIFLGKFVLKHIFKVIRKYWHSALCTWNKLFLIIQDYRTWDFIVNLLSARHLLRTWVPMKCLSLSCVGVYVPRQKNV